MREAMYCHAEAFAAKDVRQAEHLIRCDLCPRACLLANGQIGFCKGRKVINGVLYAINYAQCVAIAMDPIEKKPLYHYNPGTQIVSLGPNDCNLDCSFCQNWQISQHESPTETIGIEELEAIVRANNPPQVAFTYSEPTMWYEYIYDLAAFAPDIQIVLVTNGYLNEKPWKQMMSLVKAVNIDLKAFTDEFYQTQCSGHLEPVKRNIRIAFEAGVLVEITTLLIPGLNDKKTEIDALAAFIAKIDAEIPLHISAYHPCNRLQIQATTDKEVLAACDIAAHHLQHVYAGNVYLPKYSQKSK
ncbi:MAG: AmmeMemoRadiSam system radical SAM enzyme [Candidatus Cloacimonas sp.]|jgi:pyruvate formate lyase activating enzyme|nr:AmmeMemoRadiSam system radical SAM enzyme [Candidatus Cloacimonas sp.]